MMTVSGVRKHNQTKVNKQTNQTVFPFDNPCDLCFTWTLVFCMITCNGQTDTSSYKLFCSQQLWAF